MEPVMAKGVKVPNLRSHKPAGPIIRLSEKAKA